MADVDHTLESSSAQENSPQIIDLIVQEIFVAAPTGIGSLAMSVIPREYEPSILLQGEWVRKMGFKIGQPIRVTAKHNLLQVERAKVSMHTRYLLCDDEEDEDDILLFDDLKEEIDVIKAEYDDKKQGGGGDRNGGAQGSEKGSEKGRKNGSENGSEVKRRKGHKNGGKNGNENGDQNGSKSDDKSEVLAEVNCGDDRD